MNGGAGHLKAKRSVQMEERRFWKPKWRIALDRNDFILLVEAEVEVRVIQLKVKEKTKLEIFIRSFSFF